MKRLVLGVLAHVDSGKTTLSEGILYQSGSIRSWGRVDNKDAFLDNFDLERARGITIFSKQAKFQLGDMEVTLLDTPGHVDFSAEMERTLQVLDYAILIVSGGDGVQGHTQTLWRLLRQYQIPTFLFINKMDQKGEEEEKINRDERQKLLSEIRMRLSENCFDFSEEENEEFLEGLALTDEAVMEHYLETGEVSREERIRLIAERKVFPCFFGAALKKWGIDKLLKGIEQYVRILEYPKEFGAKVFKIAHDAQGNRLTYMKITGGSLKMRETLKDGDWEEKANQIRIYSGPKYETVNEAEAGMVCAVLGLTKTYPGEGLGIEKESETPLLEPVLTYRLQFPPECDASQMLKKMQILEEEEPQLHIVWNEQVNEIQAQIMGEIQVEILKSLILERFGTEVSFGKGNIVYKETIANKVEGVGHFEPLRHYAEVHLLMEPAERGSGIELAVKCSEDLLDKNWQRLILTHLEEKRHIGVLTGAPITDMKITLIAGKAHKKHTEGGDFRQATYRAVRHGLMQAESVLLEPYYSFRIELPTENIGRALMDLERMHGSFDQPMTEGEKTVITGSVPVASMRDYQRELTAYTHGRGRLFCALKGYEICHNPEEVIEEIGYHPENDVENPADSVFCSHGAGVIVPWDQVREQMHVDTGFSMEKKWEVISPEQKAAAPKKKTEYGATEKELAEIFERVHGPIKRHVETGKKVIDHSKKREADQSRIPKAGQGIIQRGNAFEEPVGNLENNFRDSYGYRKEKQGKSKKKEATEYFLVDGYNIIFAWEELKHLAEKNIDAARNELMEILSNYQGYKNCTLILVFDAYKVKGNPGDIQKYNNIYIVYTKEAETADQYIEKTAHEMGKKYSVTVATSDGLEQIIILGEGCRLMSARELKEEVHRTNIEIREEFERRRQKEKTYIMDEITPEVADYIEEIRLGTRN